MKILASDFDGTLFYNNEISERDRIAIKKFQSLGNKFGIVTGRDIDNGLIISRSGLFVPDFTICCTGAIIMDRSGKIIYSKTAPYGDFFNDIIKKATELKATLFMISDGLIKWNVDVWGVNKTDFTDIKKFTQANTWFNSTDDAKKFADYVKENYSQYINVHQNGLGVDMPPKDTSKVTGIYKVAEYFKADKIYTAGDNVNDLEMIEEFNGFAMGNAVREVRKKAHRHTDRIADLIEEIINE